MPGAERLGDIPTVQTAAQADIREDDVYLRVAFETLKCRLPGIRFKDVEAFQAKNLGAAGAHERFILNDENRQCLVAERSQWSDFIEGA